MASGWLVAPAPRPVAVRRLLLLGAVGVAPDLDLLVGAHSGPSHGLGAAALAGLLALGFGLFAEARRARGGARGWAFGARARLAVAVATAYGSHTLLDWLGSDTRAPIGIMALWPFTREYYESSLHVFMGISRRFWHPQEFWLHNMLAVGRELLILVPLVALVVRARWRE